MKKYYVYIILCGDKTYYTGYTDDIEKRLKKHKSNQGAKYTKGRGPLELVYTEQMDTKSSALKREYEIKKLTKSRKEELVNDYNERNKK
ncbi:MAG: GIY-YIG nuclease family protein [Anaerorhabdus sp.]